MPNFIRNLMAAPHRALFLPGAFQTLLTMFWWAMVIGSRLSDGFLLPDTVVPPSAAHGWMMLYGVFPFFIFGFLFTAGPNWLGVAPISRRDYLITAGFMALGSALFFPGLYAMPVLIAALALHVIGWGVGVFVLLSAVLASTASDRRHTWVAWTGLLVGLLGNVFFLLASLGIEFPVSTFFIAETLAIWGFLLPVFLAVCHRMIPWFTSRVVPNYVVIRPYPILWALLAGCAAHVVLNLLMLPQWLWLVDFPMAGLAFWLSWNWGLRRSLAVRLLAMLHIAFVWSGVAFGLFALESLIRLSGGSFSLGLAPQHALGIGFFGSMLIGMASRVSLGHSGRKLEADGMTWLAFWLVQFTATFRMLPDIFPALPYSTILLSAFLWLLVFALWSGTFTPLYWRVRADGKAG